MMRYATVLLAAMVLSGCALLDNILPPEYDNNEYMQFARLETHSQFLLAECDDADDVRARLELMAFDAELLITYSTFLPRRSDVIQIGQLLEKDVQEMRVRYQDTASPAYCKLKARAFAAKAQRAMLSIGKTQTE